MNQKQYTVDKLALMRKPVIAYRLNIKFHNQQ